MKILFILTLLISSNLWASYKLECMETARNEGMSSRTTNMACKNPTQYSKICIETARKHSMSSDNIAIACNNAAEITALCIEVARNNRMNSNHTAEGCKNTILPVTEVITIHQNEQYRMILLDILKNIDENPERAKAQTEQLIIDLE